MSYASFERSHQWIIWLLRMSRAWQSIYLHSARSFRKTLVSLHKKQISRILLGPCLCRPFWLLSLVKIKSNKLFYLSIATLNCFFCSEGSNCLFCLIKGGIIICPCLSMMPSSIVGKPVTVLCFWDSCYYSKSSVQDYGSVKIWLM